MGGAAGQPAPPSEPQMDGPEARGVLARPVVPECAQGALCQLQGLAQHLHATEPQAVLAQVQADQGLVDGKHGGQVGTAERGDVLDFQRGR